MTTLRGRGGREGTLRNGAVVLLPAKQDASEKGKGFSLALFVTWPYS